MVNRLQNSSPLDRRPGRSAPSTPLAKCSVRRFADRSDGFVVPMPWGEGTDWYRNVRAAGECVIRWKGRDYPLAQPEVLDATAAQAAFSASQRAALVRFGINHVLRLHQRA